MNLLSRLQFEALSASKSMGKVPGVLEELLIPCFGVWEADQKEAAEQIVKRRKYGHKQGPRSGEEESPPIPLGIRYGPVHQHGEAFSSRLVIELQGWGLLHLTQDVLFQRIAQQVDQFQTLHVEICRGTERFRPPKAGIDL